MRDDAMKGNCTGIRLSFFTGRKVQNLFAPFLLSLLALLPCCEGKKNSKAEAAGYAAAADAAYLQRRIADAQELYHKALSLDAQNIAANNGVARLLDHKEGDNLQALLYYRRCLDLPLQESLKAEIQSRVKLLTSMIEGQTEDPVIVGREILLASAQKDSELLKLRLGPAGAGLVAEQGGLTGLMGQLATASASADSLCWRDFPDMDTARVIFGSAEGKGTLSLVFTRADDDTWLLNNFRQLSE